MKPLRSTWLPERILPWLGSSGSAFGAFAMLCCFGWTGLATFLPMIGLGFLVRFSVALRLIWIALAFMALGLAVSFRRHRRPWPLGMVYTGLGLLSLGSALDVGCIWRTTRKCQGNQVS